MWGVSAGRKASADELGSGPSHSCWPNNVRDSLRRGGRVQAPIHLHHRCLCYNISHNPTAQNATSISTFIITSNFPPSVFKLECSVWVLIWIWHFSEACCVLISTPHLDCRNVVNLISILQREAVYHPLVRKECLEAGICTEKQLFEFWIRNS